MDIEEYFNNPENTKHELNLGRVYTKLIYLGSLNQAYLRSILKRQIEIKEILSGTPELILDNSLVHEKLRELEVSILELANEEFLEHIQSVFE